MKKLLALGAVILLCLTVAACGHTPEPEEEAEAQVAETEDVTEPEAAEEAEMPAELVGSWQLDGDPAASLKIEADGTVSFFLSGGHDGEGKISMEEGRAVAHTVSYLEGVDDSFVLTPEQEGDQTRVKMEYQGETYYWTAAGAASQQQEAATTARVDQGFEDCLDHIRSRVQAGTSAAFMTAVEAAAELMDWSRATEMTASDVYSAFSARFSQWDNETKAAFLVQLELVDGAYQQLLTSGQEELLSSLGLSDSGYPWYEGEMTAAEALMTAAGLR